VRAVCAFVESGYVWYKLRAAAPVAAEPAYVYNCEVEGARNVNITVSFNITANGFVQPNSVKAAKGEDRSPDPVVKVAAERAIRAVYQLDALHKIPPDFYGQRVSSNFSGRSACS
jgi:hypothetical protein